MIKTRIGDEPLKISQCIKCKKIHLTEWMYTMDLILPPITLAICSVCMDDIDDFLAKEYNVKIDGFKF